MDFRRWIEETIPVGDCFRWATMNAVKLMPKPKKGVPTETRVVHAIVHPKWHPRAYAHAWIESQGKCYDWQMEKTGVKAIPLEDFYSLYNPTNIKKFTPGEAVGNMVRSGHHGPWE
jgi:hypothetical protein